MRINFLGFPIDSLDMQEALRRVDDFIANREPKHILVANVNKLWQIRHDPRLAIIARQANLVIPERILVLTSALLGPRLKSDVRGVAIAKALLPHCEKMGHSIFFLGARPAVVETLIQRVRRDYPKLRVAGHHHGYIPSDDDEALRISIRKAQPDVLLVALGSPRQEYWIHDHICEIGVPVSIGVGGSFDVMAGIKKDAPKWVIRCAIECVYRLIQNPTNLWRRYSITIPWFLGTIFLECVQRRKSETM